MHPSLHTFLTRTLHPPHKWSLNSLIPPTIPTALPTLPLTKAKIEKLSQCTVPGWDIDARKMLWFGETLPEPSRNTTDTQKVGAQSVRGCSWYPNQQQQEDTDIKEQETSVQVIHGFDDGIGNRKVVQLTREMLDGTDIHEQEQAKQRLDQLTRGVGQYIRSYRGE